MYITATRPGAARASDAAGRPPAEAPGSTAAGIAAANGGAAASRTPGRALCKLDASKRRKLQDKTKK